MFYFSQTIDNHLITFCVFCVKFCESLRELSIRILISKFPHVVARFQTRDEYFRVLKASKYKKNSWYQWINGITIRITDSPTSMTTDAQPMRF